MTCVGVAVLVGVEGAVAVGVRVEVGVSVLVKVKCQPLLTHSAAGV